MEIPQGHAQNADQIAYWNGPGGQHWADRQQTQDILLTPVSNILIDRARVKAGERRGIEAALESALEIGPAARALADQPAEIVAAASQSIREALTPFVSGQTVALPASIWIVTANT